jgi:hypothetical protein
MPMVVVLLGSQGSRSPGRLPLPLVGLSFPIWAGWVSCSHTSIARHCATRFAFLVQIYYPKSDCKFAVDIKGLKEKWTEHISAQWTSLRIYSQTTRVRPGYHRSSGRSGLWPRPSSSRRPCGAGRSCCGPGSSPGSLHGAGRRRSPPARGSGPEFHKHRTHSHRSSGGHNSQTWQTPFALEILHSRGEPSTSIHRLPLCIFVTRIMAGGIKYPFKDA